MAYDKLEKDVKIREYLTENLKNAGIAKVEIERNAFYMCHELQNIHLPKTLITIGDYAFAGCSKLSSIVLPPIMALYTSICF